MNKKTKILFITNSLNIGGTEKHISQIVPKLNTTFICKLFIFDKLSGYAKNLKKKKINIYSLQNLNFILFFNKFFNLLIKTFFGSIYLTLVIIFYKPKIVIIYLPYSYIIAGTVSLITKVPIKIMSRRSLNNYQKKYPLIRKYESFLHKRMNLIIPNSNAAFKELVEEGVDKNKLKIIYNGVNKVDREFEKILFKKKLGLNKDNIVILIVANLIKYKAHINLFKALKKLNEDYTNWKLLVIGNDYGEKINLKKFINKNIKLKNKIYFYENMVDLTYYYRASDINLNISFEESFSNAILEAMSFGIPSIVTNVGDNAFIIRNNVDGIVIDKNDVNELAKSLYNLINNKEIRNSMSTNCKKRIIDNFMITKVYKSYEKIINELIKTSRKK